MTVCIAAIGGVGSDEGAHIVCCCDTLISGALGSAQSRLKNRPMGRNWGVLTAGDDGEMNAVASIMRFKFAEAAVKKLTFDDHLVLSLVRECLTQRKREKADELVRAKFGLSFAELLDIGNAKFPADVYRETVWDVRDCRLGAEFIVYGFDNGAFPLLVQTTGDGQAYIREDFAVIGAGGYLAQTVLLHREHRDTSLLPRTIYTVFEAKKYAEGERSVGDDETLHVLRRDGSTLSLRAAGSRALQDKYAELGPKPLKNIEPLADEAWTVLTSPSPRDGDGA